MGYDFTGGRIFHFPIDFWMGLRGPTTVQRYDTEKNATHSFYRAMYSIVHSTVVHGIAIVILSVCLLRSWSVIE